MAHVYIEQYIGEAHLFRFDLQRKEEVYLYCDERVLVTSVRVLQMLTSIALVRTLALSPQVRAAHKIGCYLTSHQRPILLDMYIFEVR